MAAPSKTHPYVRLVVDYGGLAAFGLAYLLRLRFVAVSGGLGWSLAMGGHGARDVTAATWWLLIGSVISLAVGLVAERRLAPMPLVAGVLALAFGTLTVVFHDPRIIKLKPTATNLIFAGVLFGGLILKRNPLKALLGEALVLPDAVWRTLTVRYGFFFLAMAGLNEVIWRTQPDAVWVSFKVFGFTLLAVVFSIAQAPLMMKYMQEAEAAPPPVE